MNTKMTNKNVLVTGGAGFIGSNMILYLLDKYPEYNIINIDKLDYCSSIIGINNDRHTFIKGDIGSTDLINYVLRSQKIDIVMHFAAQSHVDNSFGNSIDFTISNVLGTHILLECCKSYGKIERFIHVSTDEVYGETAYSDDTKERSILLPTNPYAATKAAAEHIVVSYWKSFKFPIIITRCNNVYGPRQYPEKVIPKFILALNNGNKCTLHGNGDTLRSFIHVDDVVVAFDIILHKGIIGETYNIATNNEISIKSLAFKLLEHFELNDDHIEYVEDRPFNDTRYNIDSSKLKELGFQESIDFESGLLSTIEWYQNNYIWNQ